SRLASANRPRLPAVGGTSSNRFRSSGTVYNNRTSTMTNPFKRIAAALLLRGAVFAVLGLVLLAKAVPSLLDAAQSLSASGAAIGALLLAFGAADLVQGVQRMTRMRKEKLETPPVDHAYGRQGMLPPGLMNADENPNEAGQATLIE